MMICTVCGEANDSLATVCGRCHSYLQAKVDALDLFSTGWGLLERPASTFRRIVLSRHKNYVLLISMIAGVGIALRLLELTQAGRWIDGLPALLGFGLGAGLLGGVLLLWFAALLSAGAGRLVGGKGRVRNLRAVFAYALLPYVACVVVLFPVRFGIFGRYLFDPNPPPVVIAPVPFYALLVLEAGALIVSVAWYVIGLSVAHGIPKLRASVPAGVVIAAIAALFIAIGL